MGDNIWDHNVGIYQGKWRCKQQSGFVTIKMAETQDPEQALNIEKVAGGSKQLGKIWL
jgi:hypothetical protein